MYKHLLTSATDTVDRLVADGTYRYFTELSSHPSEPFPHFSLPDGRRVTTFCSNDYLAMSRFRPGVDASLASTVADGLGAGGSRNIGGTRELSGELEREMADLHAAESALTFNSGYMANFVPMKVAARSLDCLVFSDGNNHASIIDGLDTSQMGTEKFVFAHNDPDDLDRLLTTHRTDSRPAVVVFESIYSMEGDLAPLADLIQVSKAHGASVFVNEVHAVGVVGSEGSGYLSLQPELRTDVDLVLGTFGKGFGTVGGYIAGAGALVDAIRNLGRGFIFTTALPPSAVAATLANVRHLRGSESERQRQRELSSLLKLELERHDIPVVCADSHIVAVRTGTDEATTFMSTSLMDRGYYITPIKYPTVERGDGRLRLTVTPAHDEQMITEFVDTFAALWARRDPPVG